MRRHATTVVLLVLAVGLGVWLWLDRDRVTEGERKRRENNVFVAWRREELSRVEIVHEGETILLERDAKADGAWRMTSPRQERVDQAAAERLLTTLEFASVTRKVGSEAALGFEAPRARGNVGMGALTMRFILGAPSPRPEGSSYFRVDDGAAFVVSRELTEVLLAGADTYRDRTIVPYLSLDLARFEAKHEGGGFAVVRSDERSFKVDGLGVLASRGALDKAWGALSEIRAETFPKDADADRLTASPRLVLVMTPRDPSRAPAELVLGETCPGHPNDVVVLRRKPTRVAACAPKIALETLLALTPASLVDMWPFSFHHDEVEELRLERVGLEVGAGAPTARSGAPTARSGTPQEATAPSVYEIARRGTGFHQREPVDRELSTEEAEAASELLAHIEHGAAEGLYPTGTAFEPVFRARVRSGAHDEVVEIGEQGARADGAWVPIRRARDGAILRASPVVARRLVPRATTARPRVLLGNSGPARQVKRVLLRCGTPQELVDAGEGLRLVDPAGYETDGLIAQLVDGLLKGRVIGWVADTDDGTFGLSSSSCRVVLSYVDGNAPVTVRLGAVGEGGVYGVLEGGQSAVFVAPPSLHELAKRIYVSRAALRVESSHVESVHVLAQGKPIVADAARLREAASALLADRVASLSKGLPDVGTTSLEITIALAEGGPPKRIVCGPPAGVWRPCATPSVKAVFEVHETVLAPFLGGVRDAGSEQ